jgi:hypothetical protein
MSGPFWGYDDRLSAARHELTITHPIEESLDRLHGAGWSVDHAALGKVWRVDGVNGENALFACASGLAEVYRLAWLRPRRQDAGCMQGLALWMCEVRSQRPIEGPLASQALGEGVQRLRRPLKLNSRGDVPNS